MIFFLRIYVRTPYASENQLIFSSLKTEYPVAILKENNEKFQVQYVSKIMIPRSLGIGECISHIIQQKKMK